MCVIFKNSVAEPQRRRGFWSGFRDFLAFLAKVARETSFAVEFEISLRFCGLASLLEV
jgi:hypothetical protein